jgi:adenosylhomocysteine nucleosidase
MQGNADFSTSLDYRSRSRSSFARNDSRNRGRRVFHLNKSILNPSPKIAIIAALERELWPLIQNWPTQKIAHEGRTFTIYESDYAIAVCGGIGAECARQAAEAVIAKYSPKMLISAGIAGAAVPDLHVGDTVFPAVVIDTQDGSRHGTAISDAALRNTPLARSVLASCGAIAGARQKRQLATSYGAHVVDMEGAAVARAAQNHNLRFVAIKAISDEVDFEIPELNRFVRSGKFATKSFILYIILRPWLWMKTVRLARNTQIASDNLCAWLRESALTNTIVPGVTSPAKS